MTRSRNSRRRVSSQVIRKVFLSGAVGAFVLALGAFTNQDLIQSLLLSILVGGIVLLVEFLSDFEGTIESLKVTLRETLANFSDGSRAYDLAEQSPLDETAVKRFLERVGEVRKETSPLLIDLANLEISRLANFLKQVHDSSEPGHSAQSGAEEPFSIAYHGEDREWLLGLSFVAKKSIDAISLSTIDASVASFDGGLWRSDLGHRYLEIQRMGVKRGLRIRRIFYFDNPLIPQDKAFRDICARQKAIGVEVKVLQAARVSDDLKALVSDFIVFDDGLGYEMTSAVALIDGHRPERMTTYLSAREERVQDLHNRFERLWEAAYEPEWTRPEELRDPTTIPPEGEV